MMMRERADGLFQCERCGQLFDTEHEHTDIGCADHNLRQISSSKEGFALLTDEELAKCAGWAIYDGQGLNDYWSRRVLQHVWVCRITIADLLRNNASAKRILEMHDFGAKRVVEIDACPIGRKVGNNG